MCLKGFIPDGRDIGFDRYNKKDLMYLYSGLISKLDRAYPDSTLEFITEDLFILLDRDRYISKMNAYYFVQYHANKIENPVDYTSMADCTPSITFDRSDIVIHILEIPLGDVPLYTTSRSKTVRFLVNWRLKLGK